MNDAKRFILLLLVITPLCIFAAFQCMEIQNDIRPVEIDFVPSTNTKEDLKVNVKYDIKRIIVLNSNQYDIMFSDSSRIKATLEKVAVDDAKNKLVDFFNSSTHPKVSLKESKDDVWVVEIFANLNGEEVSLISWLEENGLVYNN